MASDFESRIRNVTAVLGPTNTGKTHLAIERLLGHDSGMIGLPLRLLAREVYDKIVSRVGSEKVALITGEEKIKPERARYWVATVEAMPRDIDVDFLAIDEIQLAADLERGHVFTDRLLHARGRSETFLLGAQTMRDAIADLIPGANFVTRTRFSKLTYAGEKKITRLPARTAVVAFSANEVYSIAELIRRQRGGTAVVLGALSPRTRNAQVALYQSGDVDFLVATDAIGMGLNLDVDHVAFSSVRKFDGQNHRNLTPGELGQIAGRAGRHMNDGTFGVTGSCEPLDADIIERLETHTFDPVRTLQWRNRNLDFATLNRLRDSLRQMPGEPRLARARMADDVAALETVASDSEVAGYATTPAAVMRLWDVCQIPDYRKISGSNHAELVSTIYKFLMGPGGRVPEDWFAKQVAFADRTDGDIDTLSNRIAHIRTWTFVSNRTDWLNDHEHWQGKTRAIEDSLSDALHECLTQRFVDQKTSALMKGLRDKEELTAEINDDGSIYVEKHFVGKLNGFCFSPDTQAEGLQGKASRHAAAQVLSRELAMRARRVAAAKPDAFKLSRKGAIIWNESEIARLEATDAPLKPAVILLADEHLSQPDREKLQVRLETWISQTIAEKLKPLVEVTTAEDVTGLARGIAFRLGENFGILKRETVADEIKSLDQGARAQLRKYGVRFGAFNIYFPLLLKPASIELTLALWGLKHGSGTGEALAEPPRAGLTSIAANPNIPEVFYRACGFHLCGPRAVRIDILERLADVIRPLLAWRQSTGSEATPPKGSTGDGGFTTTPEMMSLLGCSPEELGNVLKSLGFRLDRRPIKSEPVPLTPTEANPETTPPPTEAMALASETAVPAAAAPAETKFEDVWRPKRHHRHDDMEKSERPHGKSRGHKRRHGRKGHIPQSTAERSNETFNPPASIAGEPPSAELTNQGRERHHRRNKPHQKGQHGERADLKQHGRNNSDRRGRDERPNRSTTSASPQRKTSVDPDSPFASLGALRDVLEKKMKEMKSP
jgi:ATP-dependent RNA helicase SUPV3L1/SUV3